jgi:predicted PurR-regulated permease PerM
VTERSTEERADGHRAWSEPAAFEQRVLRVEVAGRTIWRVIGAILVTLTLLWAASTARGVLAMIALGLFFSLALDPGVRWLHDHLGWRRGAAVGVIYLAGLVVIGLLVLVLVPAIDALADTISRDGDRWLASLDTWTNDTFGVRVTSDAVAALAPEAGEVLAGFNEGPFGTVIGIASRGVSMAFNLATVAMFAFYFTADAPRLQRTVLSQFEPGVQERVGWTLDQAIVQTGGYFYSRLLLMTINGIGFLIATAVVGMPLSLAVPLALFAGFVGAFLPMIGAFLGSTVATIVTLAVQGLLAAVGVLAYAVIYQMIENAWLAPKISANTMTLSGGVAFGAVLAGGAIAGPMGAFVSLPVAALITSMITNYARSYEVVYRSEFDRGGEES